MGDNVTYTTKVWGGEFLQGLNRHPGAQLIIGNNLKKRFVDIGETDEYYFLPELEAVQRCPTKYILWYSGDVEPPKTDWVSDALPLLAKYPIVTCRWDNTYQPKDDEPKTDFGWETYRFSDQCYIARTDYMQAIDYDTEHVIAKEYPEHGHNSFERRVAQWLASQETRLAVLDRHRYHHIDNRDKHYES